MDLSRSTYCDVAPLRTDDTALIATMIAICDEFEAYGYRRVGAELRYRGIVVNSKKIRRLMRETWPAAQVPQAVRDNQRQ